MISKVSKNLAKKYVTQNDVVESRLEFHDIQKAEKLRNLRESLKPSFKPEISKKSKELAKKKRKDESYFKI